MLQNPTLRAQNCKAHCSWMRRKIYHKTSSHGMFTFITCLSNGTSLLAVTCPYKNQVGWPFCCPYRKMNSLLHTTVHRTTNSRKPKVMIKFAFFKLQTQRQKLWNAKTLTQVKQVVRSGPAFCNCFKSRPVRITNLRFHIEGKNLFVELRVNRTREGTM